MLKRIPGFVLWALLAVAVGIVPLACGSSTSGTDAADTHTMTGG
jgi:hypothetical protein